MRLPPGPEWSRIVADVWEAGAALLPVDARLPEAEADALLVRARPTAILDETGLRRLDGAPVEPEVAVVVATSGAAGEPKLVELTGSAVEAAVAGSTTALDAGPGDRWLCCLPLAHVGGLLVLLRAVLLGAPVVVHPGFDPHALAAELGISFVSLVPTQIARLLDAGLDLRRFRGILVGGAALPTDLADRAARARAPLVPTYGLTETCGGIVYGGRPFEGTEVLIGPGGEIRLRGPTLMRGYRFDPQGTAFTADGWLRTGDAGTFDPDALLRVDGRLDDLILSGGEKVWPEEVEAVLGGHPSVAEVAVAGRPDPEWGERVVAFVVPEDPRSPPTLDALRDFVAERVPRFKAPRELVLLPALPRTSSGKLRRTLLR
ncbi:MAG: long-chain fatty acid--CoA ligase [Actinobacteria bacterium]|nr:long-chain fatty acid--CoA ligase [Actinomycetota bacterium]